MNGALPLVAGPGTFREARNVCLPLGVALRPQDRLGITSLGASEVTRGSAAAGCRGRRGRGLCLLLRGLVVVVVVVYRVYICWYRMSILVQGGPLGGHLGTLMRE